MMNIVERPNRPTGSSYSDLFLVARASCPCLWPWQHGRLARVSSPALLILVMAVSGFASPASAQCLANEIQKLTAFDASLGDHFGTSALILGDIAIVGANKANVEPFSFTGGAAYIYRKDPITSGWFLEQKIFASDASSWDDFALSVAINPIDPNVIIVGAWADDDADDCCDCAVCQSGSAYIFRFDADLGQWFQEQKLLASDGDSQDRFGWAVSIWGDVAIVGARLDEDTHQGSGSAYVFRYDPDSGTWNEQQKLIPPDPGTFGTSVSLEGDVVLIGAPVDQEDGFNAGAAWIYRMDPNTQMWLLEQKLLPSNPSQGAAFGWTVSLDGDTALIGGYAANGNVVNSGAAYIFTYDGQQWTEQQKLAASDGMSQDKFGWSISLDGDMALIGADTDDDGGSATGSAYLFGYDGTQWIELAKLHAADAEPADTFGSAVGIDGEFFIITANLSDDACDPGENCESGSAYIFTGLGDCNENGELDLCDIADEFSTDKNNNGIPDECESPPCPWDLDGNDIVGASDVLALLASWGRCKGCPADFDNNGFVGASDILALLANWGRCP